MAWVHATVERTATLAATRDRVWVEVSDVERLAILIPKVDRAEPVGAGWRWTIVEHGALGYTVRPAFTVAIEEEPPGRIGFRHLPDHDAPDAEAHGALDLSEWPAGGTHARVVLDLRLDLPIPRLLATPARRIIEHEATKAVDGFLDNLAGAVRG